jgi:hypothetical protein
VSSAAVYVDAVLRLRVLSWNLRTFGGGRSELADSFRHREWDVALLREMQPSWPAWLSAQLELEYRVVPSSLATRLSFSPALALRWPGVVRGGQASAIFARDDRIVDDRVQRLGRRSSGGCVHGVLLACGLWVANLHAVDAIETREGVEAALSWRDGRPLLLGADVELTSPELRPAGDRLALSAGVEVLGSSGDGSSSPRTATVELSEANGGQ